MLKEYLKFLLKSEILNVFTLQFKFAVQNYFTIDKLQCTLDKIMRAYTRKYMKLTLSVNDMRPQPEPISSLA